MYLAYRRAFRGKLGGMSYTEEFLNFIAASPSSYHAAEEVSRQLREVGFDLQDESEEWSAAPGGHVMVRGGAVAAWYVPCLLYTSPSPRDGLLSRMPSSA